MASLQASLRAQTLYARSKIEALMINVNNLVYKSSPEHFFASLFYAEYQPASRILKYVNAGHNPPIVLLRLCDSVCVGDQNVANLQLEYLETVLRVLENAHRNTSGIQ